MRDQLNIVFDLCGVIFEWMPEAILAGVDVEPALCEQVIAGLFDHADWIKLDRGILPRQEAILRAAASYRPSSARHN